MVSEYTLSLSGHKKAEAVLARAIVSGKVFPTWIFTGSFGVGKASMAYKFAKCLLSETIPTDDTLNIDENHPVNRLVSTHTHPDFFTLGQGGESVSIDEIRELLGKVRMTSTMSKWRVAILENADTFNKNIYNSLLKFLEEPPANTVIILLCEHTGAIPKTLLSRASKLHFNPLSEADVLQFLQDNKIDNAEELAHLADGSVGYAMYLSENSGVEIYHRILQGFASEADSKAALQYLIENNLKDDFKIVARSITRILKIFTDMISGTESEQNRRELDILRNRQIDNPDKAIQNVIDIICMLNKCESQMLDKNAVMVYAYEKFFS